MSGSGTPKHLLGSLVFTAGMVPGRERRLVIPLLLNVMSVRFLEGFAQKQNRKCLRLGGQRSEIPFIWNGVKLDHICVENTKIKCKGINDLLYWVKEPKLSPPSSWDQLNAL